ncbi:DUF3182 family protein [Bradyrhizobium sp. STM 3562]|uniref:DUF3182 family protein n=1 Tax=Bradyrhizobium sp. STM 3562 TaxID=578924 RepID=UPI0038908E6B
MDGTRFSPLTDHAQGSQPATAGQTAPNPRATTALALYFSRLGAPMYVHERVTLFAVAESIARLTGYRNAGVFDANEPSPGHVFFVPDDTLMLGEARELGIHSPCQLYGAVVPYPFAKTKAITHQLINTHATRPHGWSTVFAQNVSNVVLPGYTAFNIDDARAAAMRLLPLGALRAKEPLGDGGHGQAVINTITELDVFLENLPTEKITRHGLVLEANLRRATTRTVGYTMIGDRSIAYHGTQRSVINNHGVSVYGGSHLICVRGAWTELERLPMDAEARLAVTQARTYDRNANEYPGFLASCRNYDVGQGVDAHGQWRSGVFEASWRSGGASTAELAALTAFAADSSLRVVDANSVKHFGKPRKPPPGAAVHFCGNDPEDGPLMRYTVITRALRHAG